MPKKNDTIENRVYLFQMIASHYVEEAADRLDSKNAGERARALLALADLAYVSCVVADTGHLSPEQVRTEILRRAKKK